MRLGDGGERTSDQPTEVAPPAAAPPPLIARVLDPFQRFFSTASAGGVVLLACTALALVWANSGWAPAYHHLWGTPVRIGAHAPGFGLTLSLHDWVNDGLMAVFFFLVGLEIKREVLVGELASRRTAMLPVVAALGGMLVPAALYAAVNARGVGSPGWGVPMATDIAFALGILALLGDRVPTGLRIFLAALAIADDLGAVLVIALFYTSALDWGALAGAAVVLAMLLGLRRAGARHPVVYALLGVPLWLFVHASGIHATIAGVILALTIPASHRENARDGAQAPLQRIERALNGVVAFVILPIFALANAGVALGGAGRALASPIALGVVLGLMVGKPLGITLASVLAVRTGVADLPAGVTLRHLHGAAWLGGIGFTMSLFIAALAFHDAALLNIAKIGIFAGSLGAGLTGILLLRGASRARSGQRGGGPAR
jgi:NhaA family Na+:H+ antiporter